MSWNNIIPAWMLSEDYSDGTFECHPIKKGNEMNDQVLEQAVPQEQPKQSKPVEQVEETKHNNGTPAPQGWEDSRHEG